MTPSRSGSRLIRRLNSGRAKEYVGREDSIEEINPFGDHMSVADSDRSDMAGDTGGGDLDAMIERMKGFDAFADKLPLPEETALMIKNFERGEDMPFERTYRLGKYVQELSSPTVKPWVGIVLLPGASLPEVSRLEQVGMVSSKPNQRDATWRVNTVGEMLSTITVTSELTLITKDVTSTVARMTLERMERDSPRTKLQASYSKDAVTIDSNKVEILHDFLKSEVPLDLAATLIEVNVASLWSLMVDYKQIILNSGPQMTVQKTKQVLDRMIESARRFCVRSPILFRMSTRRKIIDSNNTRYGVDSEHSFRTFTTSKGIQEIIMMSASYFSALDPSAPGMDAETQRTIRPRFLQMLTLLLSLLNNEDLKATAAFIKATFGISPERQDLELLLLKVIPLTSINSKVFLQGMIPAVDTWPVPDRAIDDEIRIWTTFMKGLAKRGYLLPGQVDDLGHETNSWIPQWPADGIHSSTAFSRLQLHGEKSSTFNEIPTARFSFEPELKQLTVIMSNDETCTISPADYEQISTLTKGLYSITRCEDDSICDLEITETLLNGSINEAVQVMNAAINRFNSGAEPSGREKRNKLTVWRGGRNDEQPSVFLDVDAAARLTRNCARMSGNVLAVAYKLGQRNVPKTEAMRFMAYHYTRVKTLFNRLCDAAKNVSAYERYVDKVNQLLNADKRARQAEIEFPILSDAPIAQALGPEDAEILSNRIWYPYSVDVVWDDGYNQDLLHVRAKADFVTSISWRQSGTQAEIRLAETPGSFFIAPLKPVRESEQDDEIAVRDLVLLVGKYLVIATPIEEGDYNQPFSMTNWLEIQDAQVEEVTRRRGRNARVKDRQPVTRFI